MWTLKISYRPNSDKEITKEVKMDPASPVFRVQIEACSLFHLSETQKYSLHFRKILLNPIETISQSKLFQGSTINLSCRKTEDDSAQVVTFNYRIQSPQCLAVNAIAQYPGTALLLEALQNTSISDEPTNLLKVGGYLPLVTIMNTSLSPEDLVLLQKYTLADLGIKGKHVVSIKYKEGDLSKFQESFGNIGTSSPQLIATSNTICKAETSIRPDDGSSISPNSHAWSESDRSSAGFKIQRQTNHSDSSPNVPDSFYQLTPEELLDYQKSLHQRSRALFDRPLSLAKSPVPLSSKPHGPVPIKFVFPDHVQVLTSFSPSIRESDLYRFLQTNILDVDLNLIELWAGPPNRLLLRSDGKPLNQLGITSPTRINVKCSHLKYKDSAIAALQ